MYKTSNSTISPIARGDKWVNAFHESISENKHNDVTGVWTRILQCRSQAR